MFGPSRLVHLAAVAVATVVFVASPTCAVDFFWHGTFDDDFSNAANWSPAGGPPGDNDTATIDDGDVVFIYNDFTGSDYVNALTIADGSTLNTNGYEAVVDNGVDAPTLVTGSGSSLVVLPYGGDPAHNAFVTNLVDVNSGGLVDMQGGVLEVNAGPLALDSGTVAGFGQIDLEFNPGASTSLIVNDGTVRASGGTLAIVVTSPLGLVDLDGTGSGVVEIEIDSTLDIQGQLDGNQNPALSMSAGSTFNVSETWGAGAGALFDITAGDGPAAATISGAPVTFAGMANIGAGTWVVGPDFDAVAATVNVGGGPDDTTIQLEGATTFTNLNLINIGGGTANLTVNGVTTIVQAILDWDANETGTTTVGPAGVLTLDVDQIDLGNNDFDGTINNSGEIDVNLTNPSDFWTMGGTLNLDTATGAVINPGNMAIAGTVNLINGPAGIDGPAKVEANEIVLFGGGNVAVVNGASGAILVGSLAQIFSGAAVTVGNGSTLRLGGNFSFAPGATFGVTGTSIIEIDPGASVEVNQFNVKLGASFDLGSGAICNFTASSLGGAGNVFTDITLNDDAELILNQTGLPCTTFHGDINFVGTGAGVFSVTCPDSVDGTLVGGVIVSAPTATIRGDVKLENAQVSIDASSELAFEDSPVFSAMDVDVPGDIRLKSQTTFIGNNILKANTVSFEGDIDFLGDTTVDANQIDSSGAPPAAVTTIADGTTTTFNVDVEFWEWESDVDVGDGTWGVFTSNPSEFWTMRGSLFGAWPDDPMDPPSLDTNNVDIAGELRGDVLVRVDRVRVSGFAGPGNSAGVIHVAGDYEQTATGVYEAEIGGLIAGDEYDHIFVEGSATLDGELDIVLIDGFVPTPGDTFEVLTYADHLGEFSALTGDVVFGPGGDFFHPLYQAGRLLLYVPIGGDANLDGTIDGLDYLVWAANYNQMGVGYGGGDFNGDGIADGLDYLIWAGSFGQSVGGLSTAVPEPGSSALSVVAMLLVAGRRLAGRRSRC